MQAFVGQAVWLGWCGIFEFDEDVVDVPWHADAAASASVVPFDVNASKLVPCHVELHPMIFLEEVKAMVEVFNVHVFHTKVIEVEAELDGSPFVAP